MVNKKITRQTLFNDIKQLGIEKGDIIFLKGDLGAVGFPKEIEGKLKDYFIDILLEAIGKDGTLITSAYTPLYLPWKLNDKTIFTSKTRSYAGALPWLFLKRSDVVRSSHPSNSYVAIGKDAHNILDDHTPESTAYSPIGKLIHMNAKFLCFGCLESNCGIPITHYVEETLGLTKKCLTKNLYRIYYYDNFGKKHLFKRSDPGGCYYGIYKFYQKYVEEKLFIIGNIGRAVAVQVNAKDSYNLEYSLISQNNGLISCDNPYCLSCNLLTPRKKHIILQFFLYKIWIVIFKIFVEWIHKRNWKKIIMAQCNYNISTDDIFKNILKKINLTYKSTTND